MSLKHLFVPVEIARQLKEKGFNEECFYHWIIVPEGYTDEPRLLDNGGDSGKNKNEELNKLQFSAPTYDQVIDWFATKGVSINVSADDSMDGDEGETCVYLWEIWDWKTTFKYYQEQITEDLDRKECLQKAIKEALKLR